MISDVATVLVAIAACRSFVRLYTSRAGDPRSVLLFLLPLNKPYLITLDSNSSISQTPPISTNFKFARPKLSRSKSSGTMVDSMAFDDNEHIRTLPRYVDIPEFMIYAK